jgi:hypothetical protein
VEAAPRTLERRPHNLPLGVSSFVGREKELTKLNRLLENIRLLTFTGSGGCGKTNLRIIRSEEFAEDIARARTDKTEETNS